MGTSSGANIAYRTGLCSSDLNLEPVKTEFEIALANDEGTPLLVIDLCQNLALLIGANRGHEFANPMV
ncbi:hypothetical protein GIB67_032615 [Kingdonia uniflora]|uniref:Uncharacterized protein n=1 Tax=Kingdonia uniflora TaxID=39325 RepID=A0A7J7P9M6_9MAGN|nr:hypothetical protein GIB67_032615 [Kingdonia uniflora]